MPGQATNPPQCPAAAIIPTHSTVILNKVKDLRLPLRVSKWCYFRVGDECETILLYSDK